MYKIISVVFPYSDNPARTKQRPALCLTRPIGRHQLLVIAYMTTQSEGVVETDVQLNSTATWFSQTGLLHSTTIKIHKLATVPLHSVLGEVGTLPQEKQQEVQGALRTMLKI